MLFKNYFIIDTLKTVETGYIRLGHGYDIKERKYFTKKSQNKKLLEFWLGRSLEEQIQVVFELNCLYKAF